MAFENHIIASMNNPNAVVAWREASRQHYWKMYHAERAAILEDHIDCLNANASHARSIQEQVQKDLLASREENRAVHEELEAHQYALASLETHIEAHFEQQVRARLAERLAFARGTVIFFLVGLEGVYTWGKLLAWLP